MGVLIGFLLTIAVLGIVAWPFARPARAGARDASRRRPREQLARARADTYEQISQLENDRAAGLVDDSDYRSQLRELRIVAARLMRAEAELLAEPSPEETHERAVAALRRRRRRARDRNKQQAGERWGKE